MRNENLCHRKKRSLQYYSRIRHYILISTKTTYLGDFSQSTTLLSEVDDDTATAILCLFNSFFDAKDEIRSTGANIGAKDVAAIALANLIKRNDWEEESYLIVNSQ